MYSKYDEAQFHLRLPHELHAKIKQRAKMNNRSLNSEIIAAIEESLDKQNSASVYIDDAERIQEVCPWHERGGFPLFPSHPDVPLQPYGQNVPDAKLQDPGYPRG